ncbi:Amino acid permease [Enhygromyxa salina]|uniref:Amino acid permease n=1 Tax=Enhygromyxa salina TaxID=215803 RepID=A0A0C1ZHB2_9BACT|nr:amino acid permease [Enhygromyxa salina]KIG17009.1 Amino acid permease [Enhygromyxa salina]
MRQDEPLRRELSGVDATAVVIGAIVGVGIFFTPSRVALLAGDSQLALLTWGIGGLIAVLGALTFAELGALVPRAGGQYELLRDAYGSATGFVYVICNATATQAGAIGVIALVCVDNLAVAVTGGVLDPWPTLGCAIAMTTGVALANAAGVRWGARIQNLTVVAKLATLLAVAMVALFAAPQSTDPVSASAVAQAGQALNPIAAIAAALVPTLFTFGGWQQVLWMGGEVKNPERNLPISILAGVAVVVAVYLLVNWAYLALLGHAGVATSETLAADAVAVVFGDPGRRAIAIAVSISALGVLNAQLLTGPRLLFALARDGRLWPLLGRVHATRGTPIPAIALLAIMAILLLSIAGEDGVDRLLTGVVLVDGVFFALTGLASLALARRMPHADRPVRMPGFPLVPLLFGLSEIAVVVGAWLDPEVRGAAAIGAAWIAAALILYFAGFNKPRRASPQAPPDPAGSDAPPD